MPADPLSRLLVDPPELPVVTGLAEITAALAERGCVVVQAPPGTGKTTMVPPAVAAYAGGRVVVTQPRRIAARAAARRLASLLGEPVGGTVGYSVRGDRQVGAATRIEFVTTGILLRRVQRDPELRDVSAVVLDEVHERQLDADLTLALLLEVRETLRPDLRLVAMSATVEAERFAALIGGAARPAPVVSVPGALHPVAQVWCPLPPGVRRADDRGLTPAFLDHVAATVRRALDDQTGDVLAFLPGVGEVSGVVSRLSAVDADVLPLHGRLPAAAQDRALSPGPRRRVVVSTAVAESSLTVPGVRVVVDAGLSRQPRTDHRRGLAGLVTVSVSRAAAEQRAGRAGREGPGAAYRCWSESDHSHLANHPDPEIATADLASFALEIAAWGTPDPAGLALPDQPPRAALDAARAVLRSLGACDDGGQVTRHGRVIAAVPADPRLARALVDGADLVGSRRAAEIVALLSEDVRAPGGDLVAALRDLRHGGPAAAAWRAAVAQLRGSLPDGGRGADAVLPDDVAVGLVVALAHPDRIARLRPGATAYLMTSGTGATVPPGSGLAGLPWLAIADADRRPGGRDATVRSAAPLTEDLALEAGSALWHEGDEVTWRDGRVVARRVTRLGAIELASATIGDPDPTLVAEAVREGLRQDGLGVFRWTDAAVALRSRMAFLHRALGAPWPDVSDEALRAGIDTWLGPDLARVRRAGDLQRVDVLVALRRLLPWPQAGRIDELAPETVRVPSGSQVRVDYDGDQPVVAVRIQEVFGWHAAPRLADGRVPLLLHLLSPARRPAAVTADLASFWSTGYPQVRAELRGRYPKHAWPDDPTTAPPTRGVGRR